MADIENVVPDMYFFLKSVSENCVPHVIRTIIKGFFWIRNASTQPCTKAMQNELTISKATGVHFFKHGASSQLETSSDFHLAYCFSKRIRVIVSHKVTDISTSFQWNSCNTTNCLHITRPRLDQLRAVTLYSFRPFTHISSIWMHSTFLNYFWPFIQLAISFLQRKENK